MMIGQSDGKRPELPKTAMLLRSYDGCRSHSPARRTCLQLHVELLDASDLILRVKEGLDDQRIEVGPGVLTDDI